ncbi:Mini-ribonuclease 3 [Alkaliphilus pronyensis]|uniref:Mini-ribonuclease 3 n=2 Tax=Alkaliphilus pronyensis TaxID=1482732 RepID=A0A6I0F065_9FIRM|nr:Mini-ribonuclease 3 [Alkaliphilus pronyensis]
MDNFFSLIKSPKTINSERDVRMMAPLVLAYIGDAIFEIYVRNHIIATSNTSVNIMHKRATKYVKAKSQAIIVHALENQLEEDEWQVVKKGRNQKTATSPKNAELIDYKYATGFEALLGYLFYLGKHDRLIEILEKSVVIIEKELSIKGN